MPLRRSKTDQGEWKVPPRPWHVLVVADDPEGAEVMVRLLARAGHEVSAAPAQQAVKAAGGDAVLVQRRGVKAQRALQPPFAAVSGGYAAASGAVPRSRYLTQRPVQPIGFHAHGWGHGGTSDLA